MKKKLIAIFIVIAALVTGGYAHAEDTLVDENGVPILRTRGDLSAETRAELGDNATFGERLEQQKARVRATVEAKNAELRSRIEEGRAVIKARIDEGKQEFGERRMEVRERVETSLTEKLSGRYDAATMRLNTLATRIESRMNILKNQGKDITVAAQEVAAARASIATAQTHVDAFVALPVSAELSAYRTETTAIATALKEAKRHLQEAVRLLKGLNVQATVTAQ